MAIKKIKIGTEEHELQTTIANVESLQSALDNKASINSAFKTLPDADIRIWDLEDGFYKWTTTAQRKMYYYGATDTSKVLYFSSSHTYYILITYSAATTRKEWTTLPYDGEGMMRWGHTSASYGIYYSTTFNKLTETYATHPDSFVNKSYVDNLIPSPTADDSGKFLRVNSSGAYTLESIAEAEDQLI